MAKRKHRDMDAQEQHVLEHCHLKLLTSPEDIARCDQLIVQHHYLHDVTLVGEHLRYALVYGGQWLALATWSSAALHLKDRDAFIGWTPQQCSRRRALLANNSRLLALPGPCYPNLMSRFMKLMLARLSLDWEQHWGHPLAMAQGVVRGPLDLALYADTLSEPQRRALGFRVDRTGRVRCPKKTTFTRLLHGVDDQIIEQVFLRWQQQLLGPIQDRVVILDSKKVRHAGVEIVNAVNSQGQFLGRVMTDSKSNEIPAGDVEFGQCGGGSGSPA